MNTMTVRSKLLSSLVKVFKDKDPICQPECCRLTALRGESVSFQVAYLSDEDSAVNVAVESDFGKKLTVRSVEYVPVRFPGYPDHMAQDGNYMTRVGGEFPDYLRALKGGKLSLTKGEYRTIWIEVEVGAKCKAGDYAIRVLLTADDGAVLSECTQILTVYNATLPKAKLVHTEWFHTDCIADYYGYEVFDEKHWSAIGNFMKTAAKRGINMILTPVFTPPLDTAVGGERTTVQLVDVKLCRGKYSFNFDKLRRWVALAQESGIEYFEISHLFTQWGASGAPKVMATVNGKYKRIFGWDTTVEEGVYPAFLQQFVPALVSVLRELGVAEKCYFQVSDEPGMDHLEAYTKAKSVIAPYLEGFKIVDALSKIDFYKTGAVALPIPSSNHIEPFLAEDIAERWTYYCCSQGIGTSNRFMAMPLARTRSIGVQMFKFNISGFLQWGYNFYNSRHSIEHTDPYVSNDGGTVSGSVPPAFPAGDCFVVYPAKGGKTEESIRLLAFYSAQTDLRALQALAEKTSYEHVMSLIEDELPAPITFKEFPQSDYYYIRLRNRVNKELAED
ncbi:MAG: DUF4091 domain-containing protein [Clostridia bacterium]|nr:DUF4091 domain-containing protein [Clostridia bacterium]